MLSKRISLGCGRFLCKDFTNIDIQPPADIVGDFREMSFQDVEEIRMEHVLEHFSWTEALGLLQQLFGWLKPGGRLFIEVPDIYQICQAPDDPSFQLYVYGCHKNEYEYHKAGYTLGRLVHLIREAGYTLSYGRRFVSEHPSRKGMPCLEMVVYSPQLSLPAAEDQQAQTSSLASTAPASGG